MHLINMGVRARHHLRCAPAASVLGPGAASRVVPSVMTLVALLGSLAVRGGLQAADEEGQAAIRGIGGLPCKRFVQAQEGDAALYRQFGGWMNGYLSAYNQAAEQTFDIASWASADSLAAVLLQHCRKHPDLPFHGGVNALIRWLESDRLPSSSPVVELRQGERTVRVYRAALRRAQQALQQRGYYHDAVDGVYGPRTGAAIRAFQRDQGLDMSGLPDQQTLLRLLR